MPPISQENFLWVIKTWSARASYPLNDHEPLPAPFLQRHTPAGLHMRPRYGRRFGAREGDRGLLPLCEVGYDDLPT